uniref:Golgi associated RAB2 interactor protein-like Rab2B-binding domain-containing protein n=1 Tax=Erpetoichthys calabaricus TaxID=27687 RepID=A0A8C4SIK9_ERPCA
MAAQEQRPPDGAHGAAEAHPAGGGQSVRPEGGAAAAAGGEKARPCGQSLAERLLSLNLEDHLHSLCDNALLESDFAEVCEDGNALTTRAGVPHLTTLTMKKKKIGHLTRRLPLSEVRLAVHSEERQQLKVELRTGHTHHLRLLAAAGNEKAVFEQWVRLVSRLGEGGTAQEPEDDESVCTEEPEDKPVSEVEPEVDVVELELEMEMEPGVRDEWAEEQEELPPRGPRVVRAHEDVDRHLDKKKGLHIKLDGLLERVDLACDLALNALG